MYVCIRLMLDKLSVNLYNTDLLYPQMSSITKQISGETGGVPKGTVGILLAIAIIGLFFVGFDQGEIFGIAVPADGSPDQPGTNFMHEYYHDMRHSAGFPCH